MKRYIALMVLLLVLPVVSGCGGSSGSEKNGSYIYVNSIEDIENPPEGTVTLRSALAAADSGETIGFDLALDGATINLSIVGEAHSVLKGEVMGMRQEPSGPVSYLVGYLDRDYGRSALYARKDVSIDASMLPAGITLKWSGDSAEHSRVLAVYGDLTMKNITITGGKSEAVDISAENADQPWTLARGGAIAVWGTARLEECILADNHCTGDFDSSRDRGAFGGGVYADSLLIERCIISGNTVTGAGAAGGGAYSVGGVESGIDTSAITRSAITGNLISGLFTYGGGVYSDGGGIGNSNELYISHSTIAENKVQPVPNLPSFLQRMGYWRGGAVYISNGDLTIRACTITENAVYGYPRTDDLGKPNLAGAVAATIGNAHAVEDMKIGQSVIAGNTVNALNFTDNSVVSSAQDIFTGSLFYFISLGNNLFGVVDFSQILVPVGEDGWWSLVRKQYPKQGDKDGVEVSDILNLTDGITRSDKILSAGLNPGNPVALSYEPKGEAVDQISDSYQWIENHYAHYSLASGADNFLEIVLSRIETRYGLTDFAANFTADFELFLQNVDTDDEQDGLQPYTTPEGEPIVALEDTLWFGPSETWPKEVSNYPYIEFWHRLDSALSGDRAETGMGVELMGENVWMLLFDKGPLSENPAIELSVSSIKRRVSPLSPDQVGQTVVNDFLDIGAIEKK